MALQPTRLVYLENADAQKITCIHATLQLCTSKQPLRPSKNDDDGVTECTHEIILDSTILYPQGGGQPSDRGHIKLPSGIEFVVNDSRVVEGVVHHYGSFSGAPPDPLPLCGTPVTVYVDTERRAIHSQ